MSAVYWAPLSEIVVMRVENHQKKKLWVVALTRQSRFTRLKLLLQPSVLAPVLSVPSYYITYVCTCPWAAGGLLVVQLKMVEDLWKLDDWCVERPRHHLLSRLLIFVNGGAAVAYHTADACSSSGVFTRSRSTPVTHPAAQVAATSSLMVLHWLIFSPCWQMNNHWGPAHPWKCKVLRGLKALHSFNINTAVSLQHPRLEISGAPRQAPCDEPLCWY